MLIVYIETNFLMAIAKGQDLQAANLLYNPPDSVLIFIPNICYVEAISTYKIEEKNALYFEENIRKKIRELERDITSNHAQSFLSHLEQAIIENIALINDIKSRLYDAIENLNTNAQIIYLDNSELQNICKIMLAEPENLLIRNDIIDNLILQCIINHASFSSYSNDEKVFISGNSRDFNTSEVKNSLRVPGIRYFTSTQHFFDWFNSR